MSRILDICPYCESHTIEHGFCSNCGHSENKNSKAVYCGYTVQELKQISEKLRAKGDIKNANIWLEKHNKYKGGQS